MIKIKIILINKIKNEKVNVKKWRKARREQPNQKRNTPVLTSTKNYSKKQTNKKRIDRTLGQMVKQSYTDKITWWSIHIRPHNKRKRNIYIYILKKGREQPSQ